MTLKTNSGSDPRRRPCPKHINICSERLQRLKAPGLQTGNASGDSHFSSRSPLCFILPPVSQWSGPACLSAHNPKSFFHRRDTFITLLWADRTQTVTWEAANILLLSNKNFYLLILSGLKPWDSKCSSKNIPTHSLARLCLFYDFSSHFSLSSMDLQNLSFLYWAFRGRWCYLKIPNYLQLLCKHLHAVLQIWTQTFFL